MLDLPRSSTSSTWLAASERFPFLAVCDFSSWRPLFSSNAGDLNVANPSRHYFWTTTLSHEQAVPHAILQFVVTRGKKRNASSYIECDHVQQNQLPTYNSVHCGFRSHEVWHSWTFSTNELCNPTAPKFAQYESRCWSDVGRRQRQK